MKTTPRPLEDLKAHWARSLIILAILAGSLLFASRLAEIPWRSALRGWDNSFYLFWVRSLVIDGDLDFSNDVEIANTLSAEYRPIAESLSPTDTGLLPNKYGIGWGLASLPWFLAADTMVRAVNASGILHLERDGFSPPYQVFLQLGQLVYALIGLFALYKWLCLHFPGKEARLGLALFWLTSPLIYYQTVNLSMAHSLVFSLVCVLLLACDSFPRAGPRTAFLVLAGFAAGLCLVTRYQTAPLLLLPLALLARSFRRTGPPALPQVAAGVLAFSLPLILQLATWKILYGEWILFTYGEQGESFAWTAPHLREVLLDPYHGLFYWHPFLMAALVGAVLVAVREHPLWLLGLLGFALTVFINAAWHAWHFGASFGHRGFIGTLPFLVPGLCWLIAKCRRRWQLNLLLGTGGFLAVWNLYLCLLYMVNVIDRNGPVLPGDILEGTRELAGRLMALAG